MLTESSEEHDELVTRGLDDIMSVLPSERGTPPLKLVTWRPVIFSESDGKLQPTDPTLSHTASHKTATRFFASVRDEAMPIAFGVEGDELLVRVMGQSAGTAGFTALLDPDCLSEFLTATFPTVSLSPALRRVLVLQMSGIGLKEGARLDNRSVETRKRQAQHLRERFDGADLSTISRLVAAALAGKVPLDEDTVIMVTGGNTDAASFAETLAEN